MNSLLEAEQVDSHDSHNFDSLTAQKMKFSLRISSVNVTKSARNYGFGHIY